MSTEGSFKTLLQEIGSGYVSSTAYDTAWVARLVDFDPPLANHALHWLCENQLPDGSWGVANPYHYHDRIISTLSAMIALTHRGRRAADRLQIEKGLEAMERITSTATMALIATEETVATAGFEMIVPTLVAEAERLGIIKQQGDRILGRLSRLRQQKMARLNGYKISRHITAAFSSEWAGVDGLHLLEAEDLQEIDGSVANSPSATAYFIAHVKPGDSRALDYLHRVVASREGAAPSFAPFDIMERSWVLWNIALAGAQDDPEIMALCQPHLETLQRQWRSGGGVGFCAAHSVADGDDTSMVFEVLSRFGYAPDIQPVLGLEEEGWFRCYPLEVNPSVDVNIHVLNALRSAGYSSNHPGVQKALALIRSKSRENAFWLDKWHTSPYYTASHAVIACLGFDDELCLNTVDWILRTQQADGAWGFHGVPTLEETAYCIQALCLWRQHGHRLPPGRIEQAHLWLERNYDLPYLPLWAAKTLYCPSLLVRSAILSALHLAESIQ
jgi:halimadienyl-diphosphate synthase